MLQISNRRLAVHVESARAIQRMTVATVLHLACVCSGFTLSRVSSVNHDNFRKFSGIRQRVGRFLERENVSICKPANPALEDCVRLLLPQGSAVRGDSGFSAVASCPFKFLVDPKFASDIPAGAPNYCASHLPNDSAHFSAPRKSFFKFHRVLSHQ